MTGARCGCMTLKEESQPTQSIPYHNDTHSNKPMQSSVFTTTLVVFVVLLSSSLVACQKLEFPSDTRNTPYWTNNYGVPISNNDQMLSVGARGPGLLDDYSLLEKLANLNRERRPERMVHADGAAAKGNFKVTHDVSALTFANFLQPGKTT